jgi:glycine cleavage system H lipoate-binding protein
MALMKKVFNLSIQRFFTLSVGVAVALAVLVMACKKTPTPDPVDPNTSNYVVADLRVFTTKGDTLKSINSTTKVSETESTIDAIVPDDGNPGKRFKIEFTFPAGIKPTSITPSTADSIDFSVAKTFTMVFTDKVTKKVTVNIIEQAPQVPQIETFVIAGAQQTVIDQSKSVIDIRLPQGANMSAVNPTITVSPNTAVIVNAGPYNFSTNQTITVKNGALSKAYSVRVTDYGFTKVTSLGDFSLANNKRPAGFNLNPETSIAFDANGSNLFVANKAGILKYNMASPTAAPTELNMIITGTTLAPVKILQTVDNNLFSCNNPWGGGNLEVCVWVNGAGAPLRVINAPIPTGAIIQNFQVAKVGANYVFTFVNREPLRRSPKVDPTAYIMTIPVAASTSGTPVTSLPTAQNFTGLAAGGVGDGPNMELAPIPNSSDYFYNSGSIPPTYVSATLGNPVWFSSALANGSSVGVKAFEHNRGKYLMYGVFTWSDNLANPRASKFVLFDVTKKGYRATIDDVNAEARQTPASYTTWNGIQKVEVALGGKEPSAGDYYCQTAYATTSTGKLRIACLVAGNGFVVMDCE